ncbi:hypothetical protein B8T70_01335 [Flavobacterium sp. AJR]|nr:hypothetical protein B8T70_01335 [Flavobacterium sp. AJR]
MHFTQISANFLNKLILICEIRIKNTFRNTVAIIKGFRFSEAFYFKAVIGFGYFLIIIWFNMPSVVCSFTK